MKKEYYIVTKMFNVHITASKELYTKTEAEKAYDELVKNTSRLGCGNFIEYSIAKVRENKSDKIGIFDKIKSMIKKGGI